jgi:glutaredoxin
MRHLQDEGFQLMEARSLYDRGGFTRYEATGAGISRKDADRISAKIVGLQASHWGAPTGATNRVSWQRSETGGGVRGAAAVCRTMEALRVYWRQGCSSCVKVKEFLTGLGVEFESIDIGMRPQAMDELRALGVRTVPVVARGREYVFAQALEDVSRFVGREFRTERLPPEVLMRKWLRTLAAAQRHVLQIPRERLLERATPGRDRSIRDLAYHVYQVPESFLEAVEHGVEDLTAVYNAPPPAEVQSVEQVRSYGNGIAARLEAWWDSLPDRTCRQDVRTYYGARPLHELLERCAWHSAQHARQIIAVLERFGIAADSPLTEQDYAGLPMPAGLWE